MKRHLQVDYLFFTKFNQYYISGSISAVQLLKIKRKIKSLLTGLSSPSKTSSLVKDCMQSRRLTSLSSATLKRVPDREDDDEVELRYFCELKIKD